MKERMIYNLGEEKQKGKRSIETSLIVFRMNSLP